MPIQNIRYVPAFRAKNMVKWSPIEINSHDVAPTIRIINKNSQWSHYINFSFPSNHVTSKNTYIWTNAEYVDDSFRKYSPNRKQELKLTSQESIYNLLGFRDTRNTIHSVERVIGLDRSTEKNDSMPLLHCSIVIGRCMFVKNTRIWQQFKRIVHGTKNY